MEQEFFLEKIMRNGLFWCMLVKFGRMQAVVQDCGYNTKRLDVHPALCSVNICFKI